MKKIFLQFFKITMIRINLFKDYYIFYTFSLAYTLSFPKKALMKNI